MALKFLGVAVLTLGLLIIAVQITAWVLLSDFVDKVGSGLWGGVAITAAGILAVLNNRQGQSRRRQFRPINRKAFRAVSVLAILCGLAVAALYTWALVRVMDERGILQPSRALDWIELWGRMGDCSHICKMKIGICPVMIFLGLMTLIFTGGLLFQEVKHRLPWRQKPPVQLNPKEDLNLNLQTPATAPADKEQAEEMRSSPRSGPRPFLSTLI